MRALKLRLPNRCFTPFEHVPLQNIMMGIGGGDVYVGASGNGLFNGDC